MLTKKLQVRIQEIEDDRGNDNGWWIHYHSGWKSASDPLGVVHSDHEDTKAEVLRCAKEALPCKCDECIADLVRKKK